MSMRWKCVFVTTVLWLSVWAVYAQEDANATSTDKTAEPAKLQVNGEQIKEYITWMAKDELQGRKSLTPSFDKSVEWAVNHFQTVGA